MDDSAREQYEQELAAAILLLWIFFESHSKTRPIDFAAFLAVFDQHVRPILARVYGNARNDLASRFGYAYQSRPAVSAAAESAGTIIQIPNLNRTIDQYAEDFYSRFVARHSNWEQAPKEERPKRPQFTESDAESYAVTNVTGAKSNGEHDAARDVESRIGTRLVPMWKTEPGACPICRPLEGKGPYAWRARFPNGPPAHPNCVLAVTPVSVASIVAGVHAHYEGPIVRIECSEGSCFDVTPNHMLLTPMGFARADSLVEGDDVISAPLIKSQHAPDFHNPNDDRQPPTAEQVFHSLAVAGGMLTTGVPVATEHLHGDAAFVDGQVDVVWADCELREDLNAAASQPFCQLQLIFRLDRSADLARLRQLGQLLGSLRDATDGGVGFVRERKSLILAHLRHAKDIRLTTGADSESKFSEPVANCSTADAQRIAHVQNTFAGFITTAKIIKVYRYSVSHAVSVYDFETLESMYLVGNGIVSSNCRCDLAWRPLIG